MNNKFVVHHVGARNGSRGFPVIKKLESDIVTVFYEASEDGNDQILSQAKRNEAGETLLVNACIGSSNQIQDFYLNRDPFMSSLYEANADYSDFYNDLATYDNVMGQILEPVEVSKIEVTSLDEVIDQRNLPLCDFLSIDVQGGELDVLKGAENSLKNSSGVLVEVEFAKMYRDQPLFGEVDKFLTDNGFMFIRFLGFQEWAPLTLPIVGRGKKLHVAADALYLKDWRLNQSINADRLIFSALAFGQTEFAFKVKDRLIEPLLDQPKGSWQTFVYKFIESTNSLKNFPPTFSDVYSIEQSFGRFNEKYTPLPRRIRIIESVFKLWRLLPIAFRSKVVRFLGLVKKRLVTFRRVAGRPSELERLFSEVGLESVASEMKRSRLR